MKSIFAIRCYDNGIPKYWIKYKTGRTGSRWKPKISIDCFYSSLGRAELAAKDEGFHKEHYEILEFCIENHTKAIQY